MYDEGYLKELKYMNCIVFLKKRQSLLIVKILFIMRILK